MKVAMNKFILVLAVSLWMGGWGTELGAEPVSPKLLKDRPKLILVVVYDQFRADYLTRFRHRFLPAVGKGGSVGGFQYLLNKGAFFPNGQYELLQDMTGPGHATILSGSYPYQSSIALNDWVDAKTGEKVYCVEDKSASTVGATPKDPHVGTSPANFIGTTVGDELKNAGYQSKVVAIALKDRASILMGGHRADLAMWFNAESMQWVSSRYYLPDGKLPAWITELNDRIKAKVGQKGHWNGTPSKDLLRDDSVVLDKKLQSFGLTFPHEFDLGTKWAMSTPVGTEATAEAAMKAAEVFKLGNGPHSDILAVSFSSHDYMGHVFGPNTGEMEEMTVADDKALASLLNYFQKHVPGGLKNVTVVLTADHGIPPNPDWLVKKKIAAGRLEEKKLVDKVEGRLRKVIGDPKSEKWIVGVSDFNFYLDHRSVAESSLGREAIENALREALRSESDAWAYVFTSTDVRRRTLPAGLLEKQILKSYYFGRSGDVVAIPKPFFMNDGYTTTHMTGYSYDRTVPIVLAGYGIRPGLFAESARVVDIAPTLSFLTGTIPPALSEGVVLGDALIR
jgi:predicted AlkP superfamily pyrophosphatase or phosphodiesterase